MSTRLRATGVLITTALMGLCLMAASVPVNALASNPWVSVDRVMVNKLGGVSVVGSVDCAAVATTVRAGEFQYLHEGEFGEEWATLTVPEDTPEDTYLLVLSANTDNYVVSQPAGRRQMVQVEHQSSRMSPCFTEYFLTPQGGDMPCDESGAPCRWATDHFGYDPDQGPLFDYAPDGRFKAGLLNVSVESVGLLVEVVHLVNGELLDRAAYYAPEGSYAYTSMDVRAVGYRG
jgi:hypothetical protein